MAMTGVLELQTLECPGERSSDEDTEDASEPDLFRMNEDEAEKGSYEERTAALKEQLKRIEQGTDPEYLRRVEELREIKEKRAFLAHAFREFELQAIKEQYEQEKSQALHEYETKKQELKESLLMDLNEKKKMLENLRTTMEITSTGTCECLFEPKMTRKLRRRHYEPAIVPEKKRKPSPFSFPPNELDELDVEEDLRVICKGKPVGQAASPVDETSDSAAEYGVKVEDGRLNYEGKWFAKNQHIIIDSKDRGQESGVITSISQSEIWVRLSEGNKLRIYLSHLTRGRFQLRKKTT